MAGINLKQVAGKHLPMFESYYLSQDPTGKGSIPAMDAAKFLKRSGLSDSVLGNIWNLSDPQGKGHLDKLGLFISLKLIGMAQSGREVSITQILDDSVPEPDMSGGSRKPEQTQAQPMAPPTVTSAPLKFDWTIKESEMGKYRQLFLNIGPENGKVPGGKAKTLLMDSKLPLDILGKVWDLADADKDGSLSEGEFIIAMHLVYKCLEKYPVPESLPSELKYLLSLSEATNAVVQPQPPLQAQLPPQPVPPMQMPPAPVPPMQLPPAPVPPMQMPPASVPPMQMPPAPVPVKQPALVDSWIVPQEDRIKFQALFQATDLDRDGYVSGMEIKGVFLQSGLPQPTLAHIWNLCDHDQSGKLDSLHFILAMWLVSNSLRGFQLPQALTPEMFPPGSSGVGVAVAIPQEPVEQLPPEFELIMKEIRELSEEKLNLEYEISAKESDKKIKANESKSLQSELETLAATLKQLETQKSVARGKLAELEGQVTTLRFQAEEQESSLIAQELEVSSKSNELKEMDEEELKLTSDLETFGRDIERLGIILQDTLLQISQAKTRVSSLKDLETTMNESILKYVSALESNNAYVITEPELRDVKPELDELIGVESPAKYFNGESGQNGFENAFTEQQSSFPSSPHAGTSWGNEFGSAPGRPDPFAPRDPFAPVSTQDPFGASPSGKKDVSPGKDPFGAEPFAAEAPALPPKKAPPRPAPPKNAPARPPPPSFRPGSTTPAAPPKPAATNDMFSQGDFSPNFEAGFADFSNFDSQWTQIQQNPPSTVQSPNSVANLEFTEDPFKNYRYEDPFANSDPFTG